MYRRSFALLSVFALLAACGNSSDDGSGSDAGGGDGGGRNGADAGAGQDGSVSGNGDAGGGGGGTSGKDGGGGTTSDGGAGNDASTTTGDDGGGTGWQEADEPLPGTTVSEMKFVDDKRGYLLVNDQLQAGMANVYYTSDGGYTWQPRTLGGTQAQTVAFTSDGSSVWIGGTGGTASFWSSSDSGMDFAPLPELPQMDWPGGSFFWDSKNGVVGGETSDAVYKTTDGGNTWTEHDFGRDVLPGAHSLKAFGNNVTIVGGQSGDRTGAAVAWSPDQGGTWTTSSLTDNANNFAGGALHDSAIVSATEMSVVGEGQQIFHTTDGRQTWTQVAKVPTDIDTFGGVYVNGKEIITVGWLMNTMTIFQSEDGGATFTEAFQGQCALTCDQLRLTMVTPNLGYVYGYAGTFYRFTR